MEALAAGPGQFVGIEITDEGRVFSNRVEMYEVS